MELFKLSILAIVLYTQLHTGVSSEGMGIWPLENWQSDPAESVFTLRINDLLKHSKSQQFHGLMGRSLERSQPLQHGPKRNSGERFVGLMGKRSVKEDLANVPGKPQYC